MQETSHLPQLIFSLFLLFVMVAVPGIAFIKSLEFLYKLWLLIWEDFHERNEKLGL